MRGLGGPGAEPLGCWAHQSKAIVTKHTDQVLQGLSPDYFQNGYRRVMRVFAVVLDHRAQKCWHTIFQVAAWRPP